MWGAVLFWGDEIVNPNSSKARRRFSWPAAFTLAVLVVASLGMFVFLRLESWPARTLSQGTTELERVGRDVRDALVEMAQLQPRVTVNNRIYLERTTATAQLAILSRQVAVIRKQALIINLPGQPKAIRETLEGLKDESGKAIVSGIFAAVPYCIDLIGGPYIETNDEVVKAFRPKSAIRQKT